VKKVLSILFGLFLLSCGHISYKPVNPHTVHRSVGKIIVFDTVELDGVEKEVALGGGTGFAISEHEILTANHVCEVVEEGLKLRLEYFDGFKQVLVPDVLIPIKQDKSKDLCILFTFNNPLKPIPFSGRWPKMGDKAFIFGAPGLIAYVLTEGYYSHSMLIEMAPDKRILANVLSVPSFPGNSGSPVLDEDGKFIGVLIAGFSRYHHVTLTPAYIEVRDFLKR
jgi:S1-C subfamily serine protease